MDLGLIGIMVGFGCLVAGYLFGSFKSNKQIVDAVQERDDALEKLRKADKKSSKKADKKEAQAPTKSKELKEAKSEIKKLKKQVYDLKEAQKNAPKPKKSKKKNKKGKSNDSDVIFELREEIGDLKSKLVAAEDALANAPKAVVADVDVEAPETNASDSEEVKALKDKQREQLKALKDKNFASEKEIKQKLKKASSNVDKQRRRADNNDKAFKIAQRQVDGLQERIAQLERELNGTAAPVPQVTTKVADSTAEIPVHAAVDPDPEPTPEPVQDDAPAPGFVMTKEAEPNTVEISEEMADDILAEADEELGMTERSTVDLTPESLRSTAPLAAMDPSTPDQPAQTEEEEGDDGKGSTAILTPKALAEAGFDPGALGDEASSVDDAWAEFDVD